MDMNNFEFSPVQDTNDSSTVSKASVSAKGYFVDRYIEKFVSHPANRSPLINRGYYIRCKAIDHVMRTFLHHGDPLTMKQVLSLGAGFDTSFFRLSKGECIHNSVKYFEIDFPRVVRTKVERILKCDVMLSCLDQWSVSDGCLDSSNYTVIGCDITNLELLESSLIKHGLEFSSPTLIISECVLTYIAPEKVDCILQWCSGMFGNSMMCTYEQVYPDDGFGKVMQEHFRKVSSPLMNIATYDTPEKQERRYLKLGWKHCQSCSMFDYYNSLPTSEKDRIELIEPFDEYEEFEMKCSHYVLLCAASNELSSILDKIMPQKLEFASLKENNVVSLTPLKMFEGSLSISRFAHSSVKVSDNSIVCIGGFGVDECNRHCRMNDVLLVSVECETCTVKRITTTGVGPGPIVHHRTVFHDDSVLIIGGRNSPYHPNDKYYSLHLSGDCGEWKLHELSEQMEPRWRHSATAIKLCGQQSIMVVGGISTSNTIFQNCFLLHYESSKVQIEKLPVELPEGRHSHSAVEIDNGLIVCGGLSSNGRHLDNAVMFKHTGGQWSTSTVQLQPSITGFSMGHCLDSSTAFLCGGVCMNFPAHLFVLQPETLSIVAHLIEVERGLKFISSGLTLHHISGKLITIGGGGNCYSFGTHFNTMCVLSK